MIAAWLEALDSDRIVILLVGSCVAISCASIGCFLVLRKVAMLGDAISHAVLPGIAIAFLLTGDQQPLPMLLGAGALGVVTVFAVGALSRSRLLQEDASIGVVFPALFSVGVILLSRYARDVHIDEHCVLYGEIALAPLDQLIVAGRALGPQALWITGALVVINLTMVLFFYKELKITSFDPQLAATLGFSPVLMHYVLMSSVSVTVVGCFESVGAILVVAMLVVPPATAYLFTDRLGVMLVLSMLLGVASAITGYAFAAWIDCSIAGAMAAVAGGLFVVALVLSPRHGVLSRYMFHKGLAKRFEEQMLLLHLESGARAVPKTLVASRFNWRRDKLDRVLARLVSGGEVVETSAGLELTAAGRAAIEAAGTGALAHALDPDP